jgi:DNA (cytosine-5)-methyltransferase 1
VSQLVLSLFPGIGLLDMAFEEEGFCIVRGPDLLWGGDIHRFHPSAGKFDGVIGGPPCQAFSQANQMGRLGRQKLAVNLISQFERSVYAAQPQWFLMENVRQAPTPRVLGYVVKSALFNNRDAGGVQNRVRRFSFGSRDGRPLLLRPVALQAVEYAPCVTANGAQWDSRRARISRGLEDVRPRSRADRSGRMLAHYIRWQGLPHDFLQSAPFTLKEKVRMVGNGVPLPMGRAIARAVRQALGLPLMAVNSEGEALAGGSE